MPPRTLTPVALLILAAAVLAAATVGMIAGREPFATWYYPFAWYAILLAGDAVLRLRTGRYFLLGRPAFAAALFAWSVPFWLLFELINFRMANWYYVFVPDARAARWLGISVSFATVLPAILLSERLLATAGLGRVRTRGWRFGTRVPGALQAVGIGMIVVALAWPRVFYPLIWGAVTLLLDPWVYRRAPDRSLLGALEAGRPGLIVRLLVGGLAIGFLWELFNVGARGKWIYTVPGLEELKLFEMPVAGFLGFPVLALDGWAFWQTLALLGLAAGGAARAARVAAALGAAAFSLAILLGMERFTISAYTPKLADLPDTPAGPLRAAGYDVFELADAEPSDVARRAGLEPSQATLAIERARLATLRGIGTANARALVAAGIGSVAALAATSPDEVVRLLGEVSPRPERPARVRAWVRAARRAADVP